MKMDGYMVHDNSTPWEEFFKSIFKFSHILIREWIKELSINWAIYSTFSIEMYFYIVHDSSLSWEECLESIFKLSQLLSRGLIKG